MSRSRTLLHATRMSLINERDMDSIHSIEIDSLRQNLKGKSYSTQLARFLIAALWYRMLRHNITRSKGTSSNRLWGIRCITRTWSWKDSPWQYGTELVEEKEYIIWCFPKNDNILCEPSSRSSLCQRKGVAKLCHRRLTRVQAASVLKRVIDLSSMASTLNNPNIFSINSLTKPIDWSRSLGLREHKYYNTRRTVVCTQTKPHVPSSSQNIRTVFTYSHKATGVQVAGEINSIFEKSSRAMSFICIGSFVVSNAKDTDD